MTLQTGSVVSRDGLAGEDESLSNDAASAPEPLNDVVPEVEVEALEVEVVGAGVLDGAGLAGGLNELQVCGQVETVYTTYIKELLQTYYLARKPLGT